LLHTGRIAIDERATAPLSLAASDWIWLPTTAASSAALRKDFTPPLGKALIAAEIIITASANPTDFFVNGEYIGSTILPNHIQFAQRFCVDLLPSFNVFAANATSNGHGGLLATILLTYSDDTTDTLVSDSSWLVHAGSPAGFEQLSFDDTAWAPATVAGKYGAAPWGTVEIASDPPVLALAHANWIWTDVVPASGNLPAGSRAFRRTFTPAPGQTPMSASIIIAADNQYNLYVNGVSVGNGTNWKVAQHYTVNFETPTSDLVLAVLATNNAASAAGLIVAMEINMQPGGRNNCTAGSFLLSDGLWKSTKGAIPAGFEQPGFDDSAWPAAVDEAGYGRPPWDTITIAAPAPAITI
jgi:hypothetical protein